jgi:hypothetical protein
VENSVFCPHAVWGDSEILPENIAKTGRGGIVDAGYPHFHISLWKCVFVHMAVRIGAV